MLYYSCNKGQAPTDGKRDAKLAEQSHCILLLLGCTLVLQFISDGRLPYVVNDVWHRHIGELKSRSGDRTWSAGLEVGKILLANAKINLTKFLHCTIIMRVLSTILPVENYPLYGT